MNNLDSNLDSNSDNKSQEKKNNIPNKKISEYSIEECKIYFVKFYMTGINMMKDSKYKKIIVDTFRFKIFKFGSDEFDPNGIKWMIEKMGPGFYKNKEKILSKDKDYFINYKLTDKQKQDIYDFLHGHLRTFVDELIKELTQDIKACIIDNEEMLFEIGKTLLSIYCQYILKIREEK